jgi:hypothetical protein
MADDSASSDDEAASTGSEDERASARTDDERSATRTDDESVGADRTEPDRNPAAGSPTADVDDSVSTADVDDSVSTADVDEPTSTAEGSGADATDADPDATDADPDAASDVPADVRKYERFKKMDGAQYDRVNEFLRDRTYITAREWAIARLCSDFRTETGVEMTKIGENLPELVPFMTDTYTPQAVNQARASFEEKVRMAGATFLYGAMSGFFTAEELDDMMYEVTEVAKFLLEVEGVDMGVETELDAEERISTVMREVRAASAELREQDPDAE